MRCQAAFKNRNKNRFQYFKCEFLATFYFDVLEDNYFFYWRIKINH